MLHSAEESKNYAEQLREDNNTIAIIDCFAFQCFQIARTWYLAQLFQILRQYFFVGGCQLRFIEMLVFQSVRQILDTIP